MINNEIENMVLCRLAIYRKELNIEEPCITRPVINATHDWINENNELSDFARLEMSKIIHKELQFKKEYDNAKKY
jgi:hypothetical protein